MAEIKVKHPILLSYSAGATVNMGNYNSVRKTIGITIPIENQSIDKAFQVLIKKIDSMLEAEISKLQSEANVDDIQIIEE